jgi:outer membrane biosynthesis protein TonB
MADEAFALSPISARASLPSEADYDAISQAFMETSRGRWFLGEYAKRNRNADTRMVLDAVERIEQTIAAERQPAAEDRLPEALAAIRRAVEAAQAAAAAAVESLASEENLAPIRKGARIIREISWRWREIGADSRICDLLDSQVGAIEGACEQISSMNPQADLSAAFDLIRGRIAAFDDGDAEAAISMPAEAADATIEAAEMAAEAPDVTCEAANEKPDATEACDEALLDMVALEMGAPDADDADDAPEAAADEMRSPEPPPAEPIFVAPEPEPVAAPEPPKVQPSPQPSLQDSVQPSPQVSLQPSPQPSPQPSLGSSLIANGIVRRPLASASDPLAPIRRMSQAEKIAFFS